MKEQLEKIRQYALTALDAANTPAELEDLRVKILGKKGTDCCFEDDGHSVPGRTPCYGSGCQQGPCRD